MEHTAHWGDELGRHSDGITWSKLATGQPVNLGAGG